MMSSCAFSSDVIGPLNAEIIGLLEDVQRYMRETQTEDFQALAVEDRMSMLKARSALTLQLTAMAAWGLYQAALLAGDEIPEGMVPDKVPDALAGLADVNLPPLPGLFVGFLERSDGLFRKVKELDAAA